MKHIKENQSDLKNKQCVTLSLFPRHRSNSCEHLPKKFYQSKTLIEKQENININSKRLSRSSENIKRSTSHLVYTRSSLDFDASINTLNCLDIVKTQEHWPIVERKLNILKFKLESSTNEITGFRSLLRTTITSYCETSAGTDFKILDNPDITQILTGILPKILDLALNLPNLFPEVIPYLEKGDNATISVSRKLCASLLANAFLCTIPEDNRISSSGESFPRINFYQLFDTKSVIPGKSAVKIEKLKCLLNYFSKRCGNMQDDFEMISFQRKSIRDKIDWRNCAKNLCRVKTEKTELIEDAADKLQVDFANRIIGGGVLKNGAVQEEIRFSICPEMILARLFTEPLDHDEVVVITGAKQYSEYGGYATTFRYLGPAEVNDLNQWNFSQVVAMDATYFKRHNSHKQYEKSAIDRELHKAFVGFSPNHSGDFIGVATGNWGCGAFNGDRQLKFFIQWMAVSVNQRKCMQYHTLNDDKQTKEIKKVSDFLISKKVSVGRLYYILMEYCKNEETMSVFKYARKFINRKRKRDICTFI